MAKGMYKGVGGKHLDPGWSSWAYMESQGLGGRQEARGRGARQDGAGVGERLEAARLQL